MKCSSCGFVMSELDKQCPRCKSPNVDWSSNPVYRRTAMAERVNSSSAATAVAPPPMSSSTAVATPPAVTKAGMGVVYTECPWQRPDGKWLSSKEIAEMEQLAHKYAVMKPSSSSGGLDRIFSKIGIGKGKEEAMEKIKKRVTEIGIPFGIFQAYANSLRD